MMNITVKMSAQFLTKKLLIIFSLYFYRWLGEVKISFQVI